MRMDVPEGWQVTRRLSDSLQMADGTAASDTANVPGTATAVFDVYTSSGQTVESYRSMLRGHVKSLEVTEEDVDGHTVVFLDYTGEEFAGHQQAALVPDFGLLLVYRAAFANDEAAYMRGLAAFRRAVRSSRFTPR